MSVTAQLATEEGCFGLDLSFLEKRPPRIAMAGGCRLRESWTEVERTRTTYREGKGRGRGERKESRERRMVARDKQDGEREWPAPVGCGQRPTRRCGRFDQQLQTSPTIYLTTEKKGKKGQVSVLCSSITSRCACGMEATWQCGPRQIHALQATYPCFR